MKRIKLGELLLQEGLIDEDTLTNAIEVQKKTGKKFGRILVDMGAIDEEQLFKFLSIQLEVPYVDLNFYEVDTSLTTLLPETYARRYRAIILAREEKELLVGMADPLDINAFDAISRILKQPIKMAVVSEHALLIVMDRIYRRTQEISSFAEELSGEMVEETEVTDELFDESVESEEQAPVVKLLNSLFREAVTSRASDIHIEPDEKSLRIRFRIDGVLLENVLDEKRILNALVQRLKLRAHLDISERRIPQDGRFNFNIRGKSFDVRLSTIPTVNGESVVMRLLDQSAPINDLSNLGIPKPMVKRLENIYNKPHGMLLVTGPTGSGKTTTLYSILSRLNTPERKILTVEDPVEYRISRICQVQVNPKIDLNFAKVLRAFLRQDPDVILVGEVRDAETAQIAMRAAITGHFVLATLHTNDALSSAMRLIDMGAEGYMVAAAVKAIIGQRLIRSICRACKVDYTPEESEKIWLDSMDIPLDTKFKIGAGCSRCNNLGYIGRSGVYELLEFNTPMLDALREGDALGFTKAVIECKTYRPLSDEVVDLVKVGKTSISEAIRVVGQLEEEFKLKDLKEKVQALEKDDGI